MDNRTNTTKARSELSALLGLFVARAIQYDIDTLLRFVKQADLTLPLLSTLCVVARQDAISIGELATSLDYSLANASLLVDKLVCNNYVTRVENANDRRHKLVQLTPKGQKLVEDLWAARADEIAQQLLRLPPDVLTRTLDLFHEVTDQLGPLGTQHSTEALLSVAQ